MNKFAFSMMMFVLTSSSLAWAESKPKPMVEDLLHSQLDAVASADYGKFMDHADSNFRQAISQDQFDALSASLSPTLEDGYQADHLGVLNQQGFKVHLWKVTTPRSESDSLVRMAMLEDEIAGFWIQ